ncbi:primosome assembly protein PriA [Corynebacterium kutscheri]|uniref:Probable replication restart protein PriA n=1 Tax=Corynebacterium kutscheri TaxID=35755 RepID=A0AB38VUW2_9CORY|nr:primosomal protein N' [Corynebacterium kutscheri]VEH08574.1 primosome assembly protein PriA [Corynebacterium kutscheri]VEH79703.1 primosome assembly protein PriA [Corynebacterium kutscheri]
MISSREPAAHAPIARVLPLLGLSKLDRVFDYRIDSTQDEAAQPGVRVRVRFNGRSIDALLLERTSVSDFEDKLLWLDSVVSPEIVYPPATSRLIDSLADRYAGTRSDLIRLALPSRVAKAEEADTSTSWEELGTATEPDLSSWMAYQHGKSFVDAVLAGETARAAWQIAPGDNWALAIATLATKVVLGGHGALIIVPDQRDIDKVVIECKKYVSAKQIVELTHAIGPHARYRRFLSVLHGQGRLVVGTRSAAFAPVKDLQLCFIKDDGDENLIEQVAPYPHAREILTTRSALEKTSLIMAGHARTAEVQLLVESGWAHDLVASKESLRNRMPFIRAAGDSDFELAKDPRARQARLPQLAFDIARKSLAAEQPVLIQVPRKGYIPALSCAQCRTPARCRHCNGSLEIPAGASGSTAFPTCRWCGRADVHFRCYECGSYKLRAIVTGAQRTAEELGRAFPSVPVIVSGGNKIIDSVPNKPALVVSTPGAEPYVDNGLYGSCLLLDPWILLGMPDLRSAEKAFAKWCAAAALVLPSHKGGEVVVTADPAFHLTQFLIRWDVVGAARRELQERKSVHFPPAVHMTAIDGPYAAIEHFLELVELPEHAEILGPVDLPPGVSVPGEYDEQKYGSLQRVLIRTPLGPRSQLGKSLKAALAARVLRRDNLPLRVQVDPATVG